MTDPIGALGGPRSLRSVVRRLDEADAPDDARLDDEAAGLPATLDGTLEQPTPRPRRLGFLTFAAQLLGGGQKRGLRGGQDTLERARATYLETEWSGPSDRRHRAGRITKTEV